MAVSKTKPKAAPKDKDDQDKRVESGGVKETSSRITSASTTAPEPETEAVNDDDLQAFFSTGHGPAMHYDRGEQAGDKETGEASGT